MATDTQPLHLTIGSGGDCGELENLCLSPQSSLIFVFSKYYPSVAKSYHFQNNLDI